jgi:hypothetical protein
VGPGQAIGRIADAIARAADGDTIEVLPGLYRGDVAVIAQRQLSIVGLVGTGGARPVIVAEGQHAEGKAIWVVRNGDVRVADIGFRGARVPDGNGAGIRFEKGRLSLQRCHFSDNQNGILTGGDVDSVLDVDGCEFSNAPPNPAPLPHLMYVGRIGRFSMRGCTLRRGNDGHLVKSRARQTVLIGNRLDDGRDGQASYEIDLPNGGDAWVEGNTLVQSPLTHNPVMLSFGAEGAAWDNSRLVLRNNRFINRREAGGWFVRVWAERLPPGAPVLSEGNQWLGPGSVLLGPQGRSLRDSRGPVPAAGA